MVVVDTNIIGYLFIAGEFSNDAEDVFIKDPNWAAPLLWRSEFRSVLAQYMRNCTLTIDDAAEIMECAAQLMESNEYDVVSNQVFELVVNSTLSAYDCEFVALARDLGIKLVTTDKKILKDFPDFSISPTEFIKNL